MEHFLCTSSLLLQFLLSFIFCTSQFPFCSSNQAYHNYPNVSCIESERQALLQFKDMLRDKLNRLSSWTGEDCCSWQGVGCHRATGSVLKLDLSNTASFDADDDDYCKTCLGGQLSPSLVNLTNLQYLDLSLNDFARIQVPTFLGLLKNMRYLNLSHANFHGEIPPHLGNLSHLEYLDLGSASKSLTSKDLNWVVGLSSLQSLLLGRVDLVDAREELLAINMLPSLTVLSLDGCGLFIVPYLSTVNFTSLSTLDLSLNHFSNYMIPSWLRNLSGLHHLNLRQNILFGAVHGVFEQLTSLIYLDLAESKVNDASTLKSLCNMSSLAYLDLSSNDLHGAIPSEIGQLISLTYLDLSGNDLQGIIPSEIGQLQNLNMLSLSSNKLCGSISTTIGQLTKLQVLDFSYNSLTDVLSEQHFARLGELTKLDLTGNRLSLNVSSSWVPPFHQLQYIAMPSIKVGPQFPTWLRTQKGLQILYMNNASISDAIPSWFQVVCSDVRSLDLSDNNLTGDPLELKQLKNSRDIQRYITLNSNKMDGSLKSFPPDIFSLDLSQNFLTGHLPVPDVDQITESTYYLRLDHNHFIGSIPEDLCKLKKLFELDLSNNHLSGRVPVCLGSLQNLGILSLSNNSLCGQIPSSLGNLDLLEFLLLNGNKFIGRLPSSMQNLIGLDILDLGENGLEDVIPSWIGERLTNLRFLRLHSNNFYGSISDKLCQLPYLQVLNLAHNNLTGLIPHCFSNFTMMLSTEPGTLGFAGEYGISPTLKDTKGGRELEYYTPNLRDVKSISLSANNLIGEIPDEIVNLLGLQVLNLSENHLSGRIPEKIGNLKQLETLDLSVNKLFGAIPESLAAINSLSFLNLSYNNLSGPIPSGNQLQTLTDPSIYEGNSGLCGKPLRNNCLDHKLPADNGRTHDDKGHGESDWSWFYAGIGPGFAVGLLGVLAILLFKKSWRYAYFKFIENAYDKIWVMIALKTTRLRRNFH